MKITHTEFVRPEFLTWDDLAKLPCGEYEIYEKWEVQGFQLTYPDNSARIGYDERGYYWCERGRKEVPIDGWKRHVFKRLNDIFPVGVDNR